MAIVTMKQLLEAGVHFGHQTRRWNPKMRRFIFGERNGIYIIDLQRTIEQVNHVYRFIRDVVVQGGDVLFVGTKRQAQDPVREEAMRCEMFYVTNRWLGGMLTNFETIRKSVRRLKRIERMEEEGTLDLLPKKEVMGILKQKGKLEKSFAGIRDMNKLPAAVFIVDTKREAIAVAEAKKLGLPSVGIVDTNCDPDDVMYPLPGNDDAIRAIRLFSSVIADAVLDGKMRQLEGREPQAGVLEPEAVSEEEGRLPAAAARSFAEDKNVDEVEQKGEADRSFQESRPETEG